MNTIKEEIKYIVCINENGSELEIYNTLEKAEAALDRMENEDRTYQEYSKNFYCLAEIKNGQKEYMVNTIRGWAPR